MTPSNEALIAALRDYKQADEDGIMVLVSRQACDEAAAFIERALSAPPPPPAQQGEATMRAADDLYLMAGGFQRAAEDLASGKITRYKDDAVVTTFAKATLLALRAAQPTPPSMNRQQISDLLVSRGIDRVEAGYLAQQIGGMPTPLHSNEPGPLPAVTTVAVCPICLGLSPTTVGAMELLNFMQSVDGENGGDLVIAEAICRAFHITRRGASHG